jgi:hypothetical protein
MKFAFTSQNKQVKELLINEFGMSKEEVEKLFRREVKVDGVLYSLTDDQYLENMKKVRDIIESKYVIIEGDTGTMGYYGDCVTLIDKDFYKEYCKHVIHIER